MLSKMNICPAVDLEQKVSKLRAGLDAFTKQVCHPVHAHARPFNDLRLRDMPAECLL
jgi:hypothetical protein|tara:strand:- start:21 stop:191 length:171 start_codon:yes stop_codon:yes gene_type:complete